MIGVVQASVKMAGGQVPEKRTAAHRAAALSNIAQEPDQHPVAGAGSGASPAFPSARIPLPDTVAVPQNAFFSSTTLLPSTVSVPTTRLYEMPALLPGTDRSPLIRAPRTRLPLPLTVTLPTMVTLPPWEPSPKSVTLLPEKSRFPW